MTLKVKGIARYSHVLKASSAPGVPRLNYSINVLIHKTDPECANITKAVDEAIANGFPTGLPANANTCWSDLAVTEPANEALKDYMNLKLSTKEEQGKPPIVDSKGNPIIDPGTQIDGKFVWVIGNLGTYNQGSVGVKTYLSGTLLTDEAGSIPVEAISSKPSVEQMFGDIINVKPSETVAAPVAPTPIVAAPAPPVTSPPAAPVVESKYQMTDKAAGSARDRFVAAGWTDEQLISEGYMSPPNGITPSFG